MGMGQTEAEGERGEDNDSVLRVTRTRQPPDGLLNWNFVRSTLAHRSHGCDEMCRAPDMLGLTSWARRFQRDMFQWRKNSLALERSGRINYCPSRRLEA